MQLLEPLQARTVHKRSTRHVMQVFLAQPRGFCAGVQRAVEIVERAIERYGAPVYVRHEIVHNKHVVESLKEKGAVFVEELHEIPANAPTVFSAHGVARHVEKEAAARGLSVLDATCPLVTKVHQHARHYASKGRSLILIGHENHPEVIGTMGQIDGGMILVQRVEDVAALDLPDGAPLAYVTQTTLSVDDTREIIAALKARFPGIEGPDTRDICYATQNRQAGLRDLCKIVDVILVVGASNSSNANRLRQIGTECGIPSYLVADGSEVNPVWLSNVMSVGITAAASTPEVLVDDVIDALRRNGPVSVSLLPGRKETVEFRLPAELDGVSHGPFLKNPMAAPSLYCPFEPEIHPDASSVHENSIRWARSRGVLHTKQREVTAEKARTGWLVARGFPAAAPQGLQWAADWLILFCALDDYIEMQRRAADVEPNLQNLLELFRSGNEQSRHVPFSAAMLDLRRRLLMLAPPGQVARFVDQLEKLFEGFVIEARNREHGFVPSLASYLQLREVTVGLKAMFAPAELLGGFSMPDDTYRHPALLQLVTRTSNIVGWANDLFTYEKEIRHGDIHNLVTVLMNERGLTVSQAVQQATKFHDDEVRRFQTDVERLPSFDLTGAAVDSYVRMLKCWIRGHLDWARETGRYAA